MRRLISANQKATELSPTLDWDIKIEPVFSSGQAATRYQAIHRDSNNALLNITKKSYHAATNEKFKEIVHKISEFTGFNIEGYSDFGGGKKIIAYLKDREGMNIGGFNSENYMVIGNSFDYSNGFFTGIVNKVMRCSNEFGHIDVKNSIRHNSKINEKLDELVKFYQSYVDEQARMKRNFETWHGIIVPEQLKELFADEVLDIDLSKKVSMVKVNQKRNLMNSINEEMAAMGNNVYGLFNGLTHYTTHVKGSRESIFGSVLGSKSTINERGYNCLAEYAMSS